MNIGMTFKWNRFSGSWIVDITDENGDPLLNGFSVVTGADLISQFAYMGFDGKIVAQTDGDPMAVPTFENLGQQGHVYFVANP